VGERYAPVLAGRPVGHALLCELQRAQRSQLERCLAGAGVRSQYCLFR